MELYEKIIEVYPELTDKEFINGTIILQDDGEGVYIKEWNYSKPKPKL